jgi:glycine cleavage system aminomethyltransferase T
LGARVRFGSSRRIEIGCAIVRASRIAYVGEPGRELYMPVESALNIHERLVEAGAAHGLVHAGFHAMGACRADRGNRHWGHDIGVEDTPIRAGVPRGCPVQIRLHDPLARLHHDEPILRDGRLVELVTSGA